MENQNSGLSRPTPTGVPDKWREKFLIKRIDEEDIEISLEERDAILASLTAGDRFIQVGRYTLMLNSIKSIDPKWGKDNIPPRPIEKMELVKDRAEIKNLEEIELWDSLYADNG